MIIFVGKFLVEGGNEVRRYGAGVDG